MPIDLRRFARSIVQLDEMVARYPEPGLTLDDVDQTGGGAKTEIPSERLADRDTTGE